MSTTLLQLRDRSRQRADMENSKLISDPELTIFVNASYSELYDLLVQTNEDWFTIPQTVSIASGANTYALSGLTKNFYKLRGLDRAISGSADWAALGTYNFLERNRGNRDINRSLFGRFQLAYRIIDESIYVIPESDAPGNYRVWYIPQITPLSIDGDTIDSAIIEGWQEYIIVDAAIKMLVKEESDIAALQLAKNELIRRIEAMAGSRDESEGERITDVNTIAVDEDLHFLR